MTFLRGVRRRWWAVLLVGIALCAVGSLGLAYAFPSVAATTCPTCFGLEKIATDVYVESGISAGQRADVAKTVLAAEQRVAAFYRGRESSPTILACLTATCYRRIGGGGEKAIAVLNRALMLSPEGINPVIAAHELSHVELHQRLDGAPVPQWFDEGLAVVVANDLRYLAPATTEDRCLVRPTGPLPATLRDWLDAASANPQVYAMAACEVSQWISANGGPSAIPALALRLRSGEQFSQIVRNSVG